MVENKQDAREQFEELEGVVEKPPEKKKGFFSFSRPSVNIKQKIVRPRRKPKRRRPIKLEKRIIKIKATHFFTPLGFVSPIVNRDSLRKTIPVRAQRDKINIAFGKNLRQSIQPFAFKKVRRRKR